MTINPGYAPNLQQRSYTAGSYAAGLAARPQQSAVATAELTSTDLDQLSAPAPMSPAAKALTLRLLPDALWDLAHPLVPSAKIRPQGGGRQRVDARILLVAVMYVLSSGVAWRQVPASFGVAVPTVYRRFVEWTNCGLWDQLADAAREANNAELLEWTTALAQAAVARIENP
jgi:transposase